jgi:hypothetical protein
MVAAIYRSTHDEKMAALERGNHGIIREFEKHIAELEAENERLSERCTEAFHEGQMDSLPECNRMRAVVEAAREASKELAYQISLLASNISPERYGCERLEKIKQRLDATLDTLPKVPARVDKSKESGGPCWGKTTGKGE